MSNYSRTDDFSARDALPSGSANKVIYGADVDEELDAILTAVNSKINTVATVATMKADTSLESGDMVVTNGYAEAGDGGAALYLIQTATEYGDTPDGYSDHTLNNSAIAVLQTRGRANLRQFGATGDGSTDDTLAVTAWLTAIMASGDQGFAPPGTYMVSQVDLTVDGDISVSCPRDAIFKQIADTDSTMFDLNCTTAGDGTLFWHGGTFDLSAGGFVASSASATGLALDKVDRFLVDGAYFFGGDSAYGSNESDSGISWTDCYQGKVANCDFVGFRDSGVYPGGGAVEGGTDNRGGGKIIGCYFENCESGIAAKREMRGLQVIGCTFYKCGQALITSEAQSGATWLAPAEQITFCGNTVKQCDNGLKVRYTKDWIISDNFFEDCGYDAAGDPIDGTATSAILVEGGEDSLISGNIFEFTGNTPALNRMIRFATYTDQGATDHYASGNYVIGNRIYGAAEGIDESSSDNGPNYLWGNIFDSCTTDVDLNAAGSGVPYHAKVSLDFPSISAKTTSTLTATVTGARSGDAVIAHPLLASSGSLVYKAWVSGDDEVTVAASNFTDSSVDASSVPFIIYAIKAGI